MEKERAINLRPGDMLYYARHRAIGFLIERGDNRHWKYSLLSPLAGDRAGPSFLTIKEECEDRFISNIRAGYLIHYPTKEKQ